MIIIQKLSEINELNNCFTSFPDNITDDITVSTHRAHVCVYVFINTVTPKRTSDRTPIWRLY